MPYFDSTIPMSAAKCRKMYTSWTVKRDKALRPTEVDPALRNHTRLVTSKIDHSTFMPASPCQMFAIGYKIEKAAADNRGVIWEVKINGLKNGAVTTRGKYGFRHADEAARFEQRLSGICDNLLFNCTVQVKTLKGPGM